MPDNFQASVDTASAPDTAAPANDVSGVEPTPLALSEPAHVSNEETLASPPVGEQPLGQKREPTKFKAVSEKHGPITEEQIKETQEPTRFSFRNGLTLTVYSSGLKTFHLRTKGPDGYVSTKLGEFGPMGLADARNAALGHQKKLGTIRVKKKLKVLVEKEKQAPAKSYWSKKSDSDMTMLKETYDRLYRLQTGTAQDSQIRRWALVCILTPTASPELIARCKYQDIESHPASLYFGLQELLLGYIKKTVEKTKRRRIDEQPYDLRAYLNRTAWDWIHVGKSLSPQENYAFPELVKLQRDELFEKLQVELKLKPDATKFDTSSLASLFRENAINRWAAHPKLVESMLHNRDFWGDKFHAFSAERYLLMVRWAEEIKQRNPLWISPPAQF